MEKPFLAYRGDEPYVFVCYAHGDAAQVYPELERLHALGINVWYDEGIRPGSEWTDTLAAQIQACRWFVYFLSPNSIASEHCRRELGFAQEEKRPVLAVELVPTQLPAGLRLSLNNRQIIALHSLSEANYERKVSEALTGQPPAAAPL